jgi:hypothetical protein
MLYRLRPMTTLEWSDISGRDAMKASVEHDADLDRIDWQPTESRAFSNDLLRIALRHGIATSSGIVLDALHTVDLGRADEIRLGQQAVDEHWGRLQASQGELMERLMPGSSAIDEELSERVRGTSDQAAREANEDLAEVLAAPVKAELMQHWSSLGGSLPD